jgi:hypothetical protein
MVGMLLMTTLIIAMIGALPIWLYSTHWGYYSSTGLSLVCIILVVVAFTGG